MWQLLAKAGSIAKSNLGGISSAASNSAAYSAALGSAIGQSVGNAVTGTARYAFGGASKNAFMLYFLIIIAHILDFFVWNFTPNHLRVVMYLWITWLILILIGQKNQKFATSFALIIAALFQSTVSILIFQDYSFSFSAFSLSQYTTQALLAYSYWIGAIVIGIILLKKFNQEIDYSYVFVFLWIVAILPYIRGWTVVWDLLATPFLGGMQTFFEIFLYVLPAFWWFLGSKDITPPRIMSICMNIILVALMLAFIVSNISTIAAGGNQALLANGIDSVSILQNTADFFVNSYQQGSIVFAQTYNQTKEGIVSEVDRAKGKDFESNVEQANLRSVGLSLGDIQISPDKPKVGDFITFSSRLEVKSFDSPVSAIANCTVSNSILRPRFEVKGTMVQDTFFIRDYANNFIVCRLDRNQISEEKSGYTVNMSAQFNYVASAYLRRYFLKPGQLRQFPSSGTTITTPEAQFFSYYGLGAVPTQSTRTNGPVDLAIRTPNVVVELEDRFEQQPFLLEVGLESARINWKGQLQKVHQVIVSVPKEFEVLRDVTNQDRYECNDGATNSKIEVLTGAACSAFRPNYDVADLNCDHYDHIVFTPQNNEVNKDVVFSCFIRPVGVTALLEGSPYAQVSFQARASYQYHLQQSKTFTVAQAAAGFEPLDVPSLKMESICGNTLTTEAKFDYSKRFSISSAKQDFDSVLEFLNRQNSLSSAEKSAYNGASCETKLIAQSLMLNDWDVLKSNIQFGKIQVPGSFGPLRLTVAKFDELVRLNIITITDISSQQVLQTNAQTTPQTSEQQQSTQEQTGGEQNQNNNDQEQDGEQAGTIEQTTQTNQQSQSTSQQTTSQQSTSQQTQIQPLTFDQKLKLLQENGFAYSLKHIEYLVATCKQEQAGRFDPACAIGRYQCGNNFMWGDLYSCQSYDACRFCMNTFVPNVYTYYREIAYATNAISQSSSTSISTSTQSTQTDSNINDGILII
jgi:hypothetical protein